MNGSDQIGLLFYKDLVFYVSQDAPSQFDLVWKRSDSNSALSGSSRVYVSHPDGSNQLLIKQFGEAKIAAIVIEKEGIGSKIQASIGVSYQSQSVSLRAFRIGF